MIVGSKVTLKGNSSNEEVTVAGCVPQGQFVNSMVLDILGIKVSDYRGLWKAQPEDTYIVRTDRGTYKRVSLSKLELD